MIVSSIGAKSGGLSNGRPRTVSLDAQTTRPTARADGGREHVVGRERVDPERLALGSQPGRRDRREVDDRIGAGEDVVALAEVGQVRHHAQPVRGAVRDEVGVEDVVAVLAEVPDDPPAALPAATRDDDPHPADDPF